jgi:hypothetical protein
LARRGRQAQLQGALNFSLLACGNIGSDGFGSAFDGFGSHFETGQQFDLLPSVVEWRF